MTSNQDPSHRVRKELSLVPRLSGEPGDEAKKGLGYATLRSAPVDGVKVFTCESMAGMLV